MSSQTRRSSIALKRHRAGGDLLRRLLILALVGIPSRTLADGAGGTPTQVARGPLDDATLALLEQEALRRKLDRHPAVARAIGEVAIQLMLTSELDGTFTPESIGDNDVASYYAAHRSDYEAEELRRASHILLSDEKACRDLMPRVKAADTRTFRELALKHSKDTETNLRGGDLRFFARKPRPDALDPPVDEALVEAAFAIRELGGVYPKPVQTKAGFSIVRLTGVKPARHASLAEAEPQIRDALSRERRAKALEDLVNELRGRYPVEVHREQLISIDVDRAPIVPRR